MIRIALAVAFGALVPTVILFKSLKTLDACKKDLGRFKELYRAERRQGYFYKQMKVFLIGHDFLMRNKAKKYQKFDMVAKLNVIEASFPSHTMDALPE